MIKVLIVDDEILIRVGIKSCIDWEANGFEIIGLAADGAEALKMIRENKPDLVMTDIKMPNMDGLELIERIKNQYPEIRIIVLSCYNELDFIKKAMKLGSDDYILKLSMQPEDLLKVLNNTKKEIRDEAGTLASNHYQKGLMVNKNIIKENLYKRAVDNAIPGGLLIGELNKIGCHHIFQQAVVLCAKIDDYSNASVRSRLDDQYLLKLSVANIMSEILSEYGKSGDVAEIEKGEFLAVLCPDDKADGSPETVEAFCLSVNNALKNYLNITLSFGISEWLKNYDEFSMRYVQAKEALARKFYSGRESILFSDKKQQLSDELVLLGFEDEKMLTACLENLDDSGAKTIVDAFFNDLLHKKSYIPKRVKIAGIEIFHSLMKVAKKFEVEDGFSSITSVDGENPGDRIMNAETILDIKNWFDDTIEKFVDCLSNKRLSIERPEIIKLKQTIINRIYDEITLEHAAKIVNMSKSYLSSVFKKETGEAFTDFVNRMKMEEARELIQRGLKTFEAAEKLGFRDESYFSKLFKKYIGVSPSRVNR